METKGTWGLRILMKQLPSTPKEEWIREMRNYMYMELYMARATHLFNCSTHVVVAGYPTPSEGLGHGGRP